MEGKKKYHDQSNNVEKGKKKRQSDKEIKNMTGAGKN
jgi:hypothetical protein